VIGGLRDLGKTVFLTTHYMEEAEQLADRIAVIADGRIVAEGDPRTLGDRHLSRAEITFSLPRGMGIADLPGALASRGEQKGSGQLIVQSTSVTADLHALAGWALDRGVELEELELRRPTLEDVYLKLTAERSQS
jgi:ABC-2 type transport system ATP-binding protein